MKTITVSNYKLELDLLQTNFTPAVMGNLVVSFSTYFLPFGIIINVMVKPILNETFTKVIEKGRNNVSREEWR